VLDRPTDYLVEAVGLSLAILDFTGLDRTLEKALGASVASYRRFVARITHDGGFEDARFVAGCVVASLAHFALFIALYLFADESQPSPVRTIATVALISLVIPWDIYLWLFIWSFAAQAPLWMLRSALFVAQVLNKPRGGILGSIGLLTAIASLVLKSTP
jgi:hypothetical protein